LALALFGIVGLSSSASIWRPTHAAAGVPAGALHALALAGGVALVVALLLIWIEAPTTSRRHGKTRMVSGAELDELRESFWTAGKTVAVVLLALAVVCIVSLPLLTRARAPSQGLPNTHPAASRPPSPSNGQGPGHSLDLGWLVLPAAVALAVLTPAAVLIRRRQRRRDQALDAEEPVELRAVRASIAALESERDPHRAILRAYARMEQAFEDVEITRASSETASEFLGRTVQRLPVNADSAAALTERFEEVRFSTHEPTAADREQALHALRRVERELAEGP
jgi:TRAP-type C4-dicarboxylate transport system permease small subunit